VERWEAGRVARKAVACGAGCLLAVAHTQRDQSDQHPARPRVLAPVEAAEVELVDEHGER